MQNSSKRRAVARASMLVLAVAALTFIACSRPAGSSTEQSEHDGLHRWRMYEDKTYGFSIKYPRQFVILPERDSQEEAPAGLLHRVRFQDRQVASWQTADLEPPQFMIEVFKAESLVSLRDWLRAAQWVASDDTVEPFEVEGAREGLRVRQMQQLAPNDFYYVATERYVFRLTPLGEHGPRMLSTFRLQTGT